MTLRALLTTAAAIAAAAAGATAQAPAPADGPWPAFVEWASDRHGEPGRQAAEFLAEHRPPRDPDLAPEILRDNLRLALEARTAHPWARELDDALFLNDVLPYAVADETRENWRPTMVERARPLVEGCETATEAAQALNRQIFDLVDVHYSTARERANQSPAESIRQGKASCTGLSILLVDACRAVGVPARIAGVAQWNGKRGNHTWVEIHDQGRWWYLGADEYDAKGLDRGWFTGDAARAIPGHPTKAVRATSFQRTGEPFPMVWSRRDRTVPGVDVTRRYVPDATVGEDGAEGVVRYLRATRGGTRVVATARVFDSTGESVATVTTKAGRADLNDMPAIRLAPGADYRLEIEFAAEVAEGDPSHPRVLHLSVPEGADATRTLDLEAESLGLTRAGAEAVLAERFAEAVASGRAAAEAALEAGRIEAAGHALRLLEKTFGEAPDTGRSLWISMHGGGNTSTKANDRQWNNQVRLYEPDEGIVVAPRAPTDTWNLWHQPHIDALFDELIATYVAARGVDPDRVYLMGYSAGGDGVYQLAPRMADRFAAAAMMAGHPNETRPDGLRNLPFYLFMGGKDAAYDRNAVAARWKDALGELRAADPGGYPHEVTIYPERGHWMGGQDKEALPWMADDVRRCWPRRVVWLQDDVTHARFYWLARDASAVKARSRVTAEVDGQTIRILPDENVSSLTLRLHDELVDLDQPITVVADGRTVFEGRVQRTRTAIEASLSERLDPAMAAFATLHVAW